MKVVNIIFFSWILLSFTVIAKEQQPLYQNLLIAQQSNNNAIKSKAAQKEFIALQKHLTESNKVQPLAPLDVAPFHFRAREDLKSRGENNTSLCMSCHSHQAHSKSVKLRSFLNMHTKTVACQTCHFTNKQYRLAYQWQKPSGDLVAQIDFADKKDHVLIPTYQGKSIVPNKNSAFTKALLAQWQQAEKVVNKKQLALMWQNIHQPLSSFSMGANSITDKLANSQFEGSQAITCTSCHQTTKPMIDLVELGADKQRQQQFEQNIIARFFKRYRKEEDKINLLELLK